MNKSERKKKYADYTVEDFIQDEYFLKYFQEPTTEDELFWQSFVLEYPHKKRDMDDAIAFLKAIGSNKRYPTTAQIERMWSKIDHATRAGFKVSSIHIKRRTVKVAVAASVLIIAGFFFLLYHRENDSRVYTGNGEFKRIELPDGSKVTLSPNSKLIYNPDFEKPAARSVWLEGEAFFSVSHQYTLAHQYEPFIVHLENLDVKVLGTTFNINTRHHNTEVVLTTGKVNIQFKGKERADISLTPGEMLTYSETSGLVITDSVDTRPYISWKDQKFIFDNTPIKEIAREIEDYYGYKVKIDNNDLAERKITGTLTVPNASSLINVLATLLNINIEEEGDTLVFKSGY